MDIKEEKTRIRQSMLESLKTQPPHEREAKNELIQAKVIGLREVERAVNIMIYSSLDDEVNTENLISHFLNGGKTVVLPRLDTSSREIIPCEIKNLKEDTEMSTYGFLEPKSYLAESPFHIEDLEVVFIPGVAFDKESNRLGRGWGCFDRFLAKLKDQSLTIGLSFDFQILTALPTESFDIPLKTVLTN